jgi:hypothetical protein
MLKMPHLNTSRRAAMPEGATKPTVSQPDAGHIPITEEMDSAKWTLPPVIPVFIVLAIPAEIADKSSTMVLLQVTVSNIGNKPIWVRNIKAQLKTDQGEWTDDAASPVDFARYFQALPVLAEHQSAALKPEAKINPGGQVQGMVLVSFPVAKDAFDQRKSLTVTLENYDRRPMVISEKK